MAVEVKYMGRLGNNLFQYAFGRIVAEALGFELVCCETGDILGGEISFAGQTIQSGNLALLSQLTPYFKNVGAPVPGKSFESPCQVFDRESTRGGHYVDLPALLADRSDRRIVLQGFFQRAEYYTAHLDRIREWFELPPGPDPYGVGPRDVLVNLRRGVDYASLGWVIGLDVYKQILATISYDRVFVMGTGIDDQVKEHLAPFQPVYYQASPIEEFQFFSRFSTIIQSNSTFCWWASLLSNASAIYTPVPAQGFGSRAATTDVGVDLFIAEPRYHYVENAPMAVWTPFRIHPKLTAEAVSAPFLETIPDKQMPVYHWISEQQAPFGLPHLIQGAKCSREDALGAIEKLMVGGLVEAESTYQVP